MEQKKEKFDKKKYDIEFHKKNYKVFKVDLKIKEFDDLECLLIKNNLTKSQFLRNAIEELKKK